MWLASTVLALVGLITYSSTALAQQQLPEITVTAPQPKKIATKRTPVAK
jgi:hypothetical protein